MNTLMNLIKNMRHLLDYLSVAITSSMSPGVKNLMIVSSR